MHRDQGRRTTWQKLSSLNKRRNECLSVPPSTDRALFQRRCCRQQEQFARRGPGQNEDVKHKAHKLRGRGKSERGKGSSKYARRSSNSGSEIKDVGVQSRPIQKNDLNWNVYLAESSLEIMSGQMAGSFLFVCLPIRGFLLSNIWVTCFSALAAESQWPLVYMLVQSRQF